MNSSIRDRSGSNRNPLQEDSFVEPIVAKISELNQQKTKEIDPAKTIEYNQIDRELELFCCSVIKLNQRVYEHSLCRFFNPIILIKMPVYLILIVSLPISPQILLPLLVLLELLAFGFKVIPTLKAGIYVHWMRLLFEILRFISLQGFFTCCTILCYQSENQINPQSESLQTYTMIFISFGVLIEYLGFAGRMGYICYKKIRELASKKKNKSEVHIFYKEKHSNQANIQKEGKRAGEDLSIQNLSLSGLRDPGESSLRQLNISSDFQSDGSRRPGDCNTNIKSQETNKTTRKVEDTQKKEIDVIDIEEFEKSDQNRNIYQDEFNEEDIKQKKDQSGKNQTLSKIQSLNRSHLKNFLDRRQRMLKNQKSLKTSKEGSPWRQNQFLKPPKDLTNSTISTKLQQGLFYP